MADYTQNTTFATKDGLTTGDPEKIILGADFDAEFVEIAARSADKEDTANKGTANGYASLDASTLILAAELPTATTTAIGALETATDAEATTLTATDKIITPANLDAVIELMPGVGLTEAAGVLTLDLNELSTATPVMADEVAFADGGATSKLATFTTLEALFVANTTMAPTDLVGYDANDNVDHTGVTLTAGTGLTGGGTIAASRSFNLDISGLTAIEVNALAATDGFLVDDAGTMKRMEYTESGVRFQTVSGTTDTLATADMNTFIEYTNAGAVTVTLNTGVGVQGNIIMIKQGGAGQVTVSGAAALESSIGVATRDQNSVITLFCQGSNVWAVYGDCA